MDVNLLDVGFGIAAVGTAAGVAVLTSNPFYREQIRF
jgi:hypothetical protein